MMIKLEKIDKYFNRHKKNELHVINNTSLNLPNSGLVALLGSSGSGKTTLLNVIGGLDKVQKGKIYINDKRITKRSSHYIDKVRNLNVGYIFQNYHLIDNLTVFENVAISLKMIGIKNKEEISKRVNYVLKIVKIDRLKNRPASMLSGGEKQRVAIARAIVKDPNIILADEPTGNLDSQNTIEIMNIIKAISKNRLVILVTHEVNLAKFYADRIIEIENGEIKNDYENAEENSLDYKIDNKIYLKDFKNKDELSNKLTIFSDKGLKSNITLVVKNNNIFIKCSGNEKIEVIDENSNIELIDDHYKKMDKSVYEEYDFDFKNLETKKEKHKYSSIINGFTSIKDGFKKILDYSFIKKLLLLGFALSGLFIMYSLSNIFGVLNVKDSYFINKNKNYYETVLPKISVDNFIKYENLDGVNYILPGDTYVTLNISFNNYYQTMNATSYISGSLISSDLLNTDNLIYGNNIQNNNEIVVDTSVLKPLFEGENKTGLQAGLKGYNDLIGYEVKTSAKSYKIVGITDIGDYSIYTSKNEMFNLISDTFENRFGQELAIDDYKLYNYNLVSDYTLKKGRLPENDYEVIVNINNEYEYPINKKSNLKINNTKLTVVGYYESKTINNPLVNDNMIKYSLIEKSSNLTIMPSDEEKVITSFNNEKLNIKSSYDFAKSEYIESKKESVNSGLIASAIILFISFMEIYLMIRSSYLSRIREIGVLRAIGVKKFDICKMFSGEIIAITTITCVPGVLFMAYCLNTLQTIRYVEMNYLVNIKIVLLSIIIIYIFNLIIGLLPILKIINTTPAQILARKDLD
ncbi:MAG: ATP-binding cassette domain-containing protein [Bacilli bacterium]